MVNLRRSSRNIIAKNLTKRNNQTDNKAVNNISNKGNVNQTYISSIKRAIKATQAKTNSVNKKIKANILCIKKTPLKQKGLKKISAVLPSKAKILCVIERISKVTKNGCSKFISIDPKDLRKNGCKQDEVSLFKSNNGVPYLRRDAPLCRKYLVERSYHTKNGSLLGFKLTGFNKNIYFSRSIPQEVRKLTLEKYEHKCILCGSKDRLEVDHKNGRYNALTTKVDDFQILCKSCNDKKRERCKKCVISGQRFNVQEAISSHLYNIPFSQGNASYNKKLGCKGCFLYDIEDFYKNNASSTLPRNEGKWDATHEVHVIIKQVQPTSKSAMKGKMGRVVYKQKITV
jgi:hypothetical protein